MTIILHLIPNFGIGGVETAALSSAGASRDGMTVQVAFMDRLASSRSTSAPKGMKLLATMTDWRAALRHVRHVRPDILICSLWKTVPVAVAVKVLLPRTRIVAFLHLARDAHAIDAVLARVMFRIADAVWTDSEATSKARTASLKQPVRAISYVTSRLEPPGLRAPAPHFVGWGRLTRQKGYDRAIRLIHLLVERGVDARFTIYGPDGGELGNLKRLADSLGLNEQVRFAGAVDRDELVQASAGHAFFLQLSRTEGMCLAAVEAMQLGLVLVATPVGEMATYVVDGRNGLLGSPSDLPGLADRIEGLLGDPDRYRSLSAAATAYWRDAPRYADDVLAAARELLAR